MKKLLIVVCCLCCVLAIVGCSIAPDAQNVAQSTEEVVITKPTIDKTIAETHGNTTNVSVSIGKPSGVQNDDDTMSTSVGAFVLIQQLIFDESDKYGYPINIESKNPVEHNFTGYSQNAENIIRDIFSQLPEALNGKEPVYGLTVPRLSCEDARAVVSYFYTYYGHDCDLYELLRITQNEYDTIIEIDLVVLAQYERERDAIYRRIDKALSEMEDGSELYILYQISEYLCDEITYANGYRNVLDGLNGKGVCGVYSVLFKMMAERVGIPVELITGYSDEEKPGHAWNQATIGDTTYYYDVTSLDTDLGKNYVNIQSTEDLHPDHQQFVGVFYVHMNCIYGDC